MKLTIRQETNQDREAVQELVKASFANVKYSDQTEYLLVERLRNSEAFVPALSIVAVSDGQIVGHILLTKIKIVNEAECIESLALAPVSVLPKFQRKSIGGQLIEAAHVEAKALGFQSILLIGHANYYPRFGYKLTEKYGITFPFEAPAENCMVKLLSENALDGVHGKVVYPKEFG